MERRGRRDHLRDRGDRLGRRGVSLEDRLAGLQVGHRDRDAALLRRRAKRSLLERGLQRGRAARRWSCSSSRCGLSSWVPRRRPAERAGRQRGKPPPGRASARFSSPANYNRALRFDEESRAFEISVRELAEDEGFRRVGFDRGDGWRRLGLGSQIHARVLGERQNAYPCLPVRGPPGGPHPGRGLDGRPHRPARRLHRA